MTAESDKAVALRYNEDLPAPLVVASGRGAVARAIERIARDSGVPLVADEALVSSLLELDVSELIPESLYAVIAQILIFVGRVREAE